MARQLVFTSVPQGLTPGRTGYCTVARHRDLRDRLATAIESVSIYPEGWQPAPVVHAFRLVDIGGTRFPVLSRLVYAGQDYTQRGHFLAHHLVLDPEEITGAPPPAEIFRRWSGWRNSWNEPPRWLDDKDLVNLPALRGTIPPALPAETWGRLTGDAGHATLLVDGTHPATRLIRCPVEAEDDILSLLSESSALLPPAECWRAEFTTCLQTSDTPTSFRWTVVRVGSPADTQRSSGVLDLSQPASTPSVTDGTLVRRARGVAAAAPTPSTHAPRTQFAPSAKILGGVNLPSPPAPAAARTITPHITEAKKIPAWLYGALGGILLGGLILAILFWPKNSPSISKPAINQPPPNPTFTPSVPNNNAPIAATATAPTNTPNLKNAPPVALTVDYNQKLTEIEQLADNGRALDTVAIWKELAAATPEFAAAHETILQNRVLPNARKEWLAKLDLITTALSASNANRADLAAQLAALRDFPHAWPVNQPEELDRAVAATAAILTFVNTLPNAPVWMVDDLTTSGNNSDYIVGNATLAIPALSTLLAAGPGKFHVSAAPATTLQPPPADQWFNFTILPVDYEPGQYLILHDATRGEAGGRYLQMEVSTATEIKLSWRMFQANSPFFQRFPANAPLRPISRKMWLRFTADPPLPSLYLLLRRQGDVTEQNWKPVLLPLAWLSMSGSPSLVSLPPWLKNNLVLHAAPGQTFHLEPMNLNAVVQSVTLSQNAASTADAATYQVAKLVAALNDKYRVVQSDLERAQQQLDKLQSITDPSRMPPKAMISQATQEVQRLQAAVSQLQSTAQATGRANWALSVAPWLLYCSPSGGEPTTFLQFTPHETGPTP